VSLVQNEFAGEEPIGRELILNPFDGPHATVEIVGGVSAAARFTRTMSTLLFGISPFDPITFLAVCFCLWSHWRHAPCRRYEPHARIRSSQYGAIDGGGSMPAGYSCRSAVIG
jgi:hypothetical protein